MAIWCNIISVWDAHGEDAPLWILMLLIWKFSLRHYGEVKDMWIINLWKGSGNRYNSLILLFLEKWSPQNRKKPAFDLNQKQVSFLEGTVKIDISQWRKRRPQDGLPTASPAQRVAVGKEEQRRERALTYKISRSKRYKACSDVVEEDGFEPS